MAETAAFLVDQVLPRVPVRQWVLSLPIALRYRLGCDSKLTAEVLRIFIRSVFASLRLWRDTNHDGHSDPGELATLASAGIRGLGFDYGESRRHDAHGNQFRYRARVYRDRGAAVGWVA